MGYVDVDSGYNIWASRHAVIQHSYTPLGVHVGCMASVPLRIVQIKFV